MQFHKTILPNGLRVLTVPMPSFESATVLVMAGAGSRYESKKNSGISHFLEHMAFKGTTKRPTSMDITSLIDGMGGEFNAFTGRETTGYYIKSEASRIETSIDVLSDMLQHSIFDPKEIDKERGVVIEEINLYEDMPMRKIGDIYEQLLYGDTPMGWDIAGEKENIMSITREDFMAYMQSLYSSHNLTVVVAGGIAPQKAVDLVTKYFGTMKRFDTIGYKKVVDKQTKPALLVRHKKTEQVHLALGVRTVPNEHKDQDALSVLSSILGGGMSSRLFSEVREKRGLGYYVRTSADHYIDCGSLVTMAGIDAKRIDEAIEVIAKEYRVLAMGKKPVKNDELVKAKEYLKGHFVLELEDSRSVASFYAGQELLEKTVDNPDTLLHKIDKVTLIQVNDAAKKYLRGPMSLAVIGNFEDGQRFEKLIK